MEKDNTIFNTDNTHSLMFVEKKLDIIWAMKHFFFVILYIELLISIF